MFKRLCLQISLFWEFHSDVIFLTKIEKGQIWAGEFAFLHFLCKNYILNYQSGKIVSLSQENSSHCEFIAPLMFDVNSCHCVPILGLKPILYPSDAVVKHLPVKPKAEGSNPRPFLGCCNIRMAKQPKN
jgi:hypothetical protein